MPIYNFRCVLCNAEKDVTMKVQEYVDTPVIECSECSGSMIRIFQAVPFVLKGKGWAKDNYQKQ